MIIGNVHIHLTKTDSTNEYLKSYVSKHPVFEGLVVSALNQTKGKGQQGNHWYAEAGKNLTFSVFLKPKIPVDTSFALSMMTALSVCGYLSDHFHLNTVIKWPNDILYGQKKLAGILIENTVNNRLITKSVIGVGLNVNQKKFPENISHIATSLVLALRVEQDIDTILSGILEQMNAYYIRIKNNPDLEALKKDYLSSLNGYKTFLRYKERNGNLIDAQIVDVEWTGELVLQTKSDEIKKFAFKEIELIG